MASGRLDEKIKDRSAKVGIVGLGYVGLPLGLEFARKGFRVLGFDVDEKRVKDISRGRSYITDVASKDLARFVDDGFFSATTRFDRLKDCDAVLICVPTPLRKTREPDNSFVYGACKEIASRLRKGQLIVLESTTYPGTTRETALPLLEAGGLKAGKDFHLAFSPERVDPSNKTFGISNTPKVVGGVTGSCTAAAARLYSQVVAEVVPVSDADTAEMVKLLENTFRAVNIALVNEMALICHKLGLSVWEIVSAAATKPFGYMPFLPGPGLGGHCIPVDPEFLAWKLKSLNIPSRFIDLAGAINSRMPEYAVSRIVSLLNDAKKPLRGSRVLVLGAAYKPEVNDMRESPSVDVMKLLLDLGAKVSYHDPYVPELDVEGRRLRSVRLTAQALKSADIAAILTAHGAVDYRFVVKNARRIFDARNATHGLASGKIRRL